jgi:GR25 family glycosyltransferase involved in LPS biosynthesis
MTLINPKSVNPIPTFVVNLERRIQRKTNVLKEFAGRAEFNVEVVKAVEDKFAAMGLWKTIVGIVEKAVARNHDYIIICEDDHKFTRDYSLPLMNMNIEKASALDCDILLGGVSWNGDSIQIDDTLFWTKSFSGLQFSIIFKRFFHKILEANLKNFGAADYFICDLSEHVFVMHPFISIQRSYPYSDVTPMNNQIGRVRDLFSRSQKRLKALRKVYSYFKGASLPEQTPMQEDLASFNIPTYIINLKHRTDRRSHSENQFMMRPEFDVKYCQATLNKNGKVGLWKSIRKIVERAAAMQEEIIIICEDDHTFTKEYDRQKLFENIINAYILGADILLGGISHFNSCVPVNGNLFWIDEFYCTQFMVIYKKSFEKILEVPLHKSMSADGVISAVIPNKFVCFPFVSVQTDFGYSDITERQSDELLSLTPFEETSGRLQIVHAKKKVLDTIYKVSAE